MGNTSAPSPGPLCHYFSLVLFVVAQAATVIGMQCSYHYKVTLKILISYELEASFFHCMLQNNMAFSIDLYRCWHLNNCNFVQA